MICRRCKAAEATQGIYCQDCVFEKEVHDGWRGRDYEGTSEIF